MSALVILELAGLVLSPGSDDAGDLSSRERIADFCRDLSHRCDRSWTLQAMSLHCGLGRTRFADLVKAHTGDTPTQLLNRLRIDRARRLLRTTRMGVTAIAFDCGFATTQHFAGVFRKFTGMTALEYRNPFGASPLRGKVSTK